MFSPGFEFDVESSDPDSDELDQKTAQEMGGFFPDLVETVKSELDERFNSEDFEKMPFLLGCAMDPSCNLMKYCTDQDTFTVVWEKVESMLKSIVRSVHRTNSASAADTTTTTNVGTTASSSSSSTNTTTGDGGGDLCSPQAKRRRDTFARFASPVVESSSGAASNDPVLAAHMATALAQLAAFKTLRTNKISFGKGDSDCLELLKWWNEIGAAQYHWVSLVARVVLAALATEADVERVFSTAGNFLSDLRQRMHPDIAEAFVFLNKNGDEMLPETEEEMLSAVAKVMDDDAMRVASRANGDWTTAARDAPDSDGEEDDHQSLYFA